jgi:UDPglucose 6-dehydrogenase
MNVLVVGTGYVGLVTGVCLAYHGHDVLCIEKDADKVSMLRLGECTIHEEGLEDLLHTQLASGRLRVSRTIPKPCDADVALIAVGTPPSPDGAADLTYVYTAVDELAQALPRGALVGTKSTVPVGTAAQITQRLQQQGRSDLTVVSIPEFLREGTAVRDTLHPHRLVFGVPDAAALDVLKEVHHGIQAPIVHCDCQTAEMIKYASNAFLATKISFINEIANICRRTGADVTQVAHGMGLDPRIGSSFLRAGLGYGGSCFPKDTRALVNIAGSVDYDFSLLKAVVTVNQRQRLQPVEWLRERFHSLEGRTITLLGVAFKPGTDDVRESPALDLADVLYSEGANVQFCDPVVQHVVSHEGIVRVLQNPYEALIAADAAILVTEWPAFVNLDWRRAHAVMGQPYLFDGRNVIDSEALGEAGFMHGNVGSKTHYVAVEA